MLNTLLLAERRAHLDEMGEVLEVLDEYRDSLLI